MIPELRVTRTIKADRKDVWEAWTSPEQMRAWACPVPGGVAEVSVDLRVGGSFAIRMAVDGVEHNAFGTYREVDEPTGLVYTWDWREEELRMGDSVVTVEFREVPDGTEITLIHDGFPAAEAREGHSQGWDACISNFESLFDA